MTEKWHGYYLNLDQSCIYIYGLTIISILKMLMHCTYMDPSHVFPSLYKSYVFIVLAFLTTYIPLCVRLHGACALDTVICNSCDKSNLKNMQ